MLLALPLVLIEDIITLAASKHEDIVLTADIHRVMRACRLLKDVAQRASLHVKICILTRCSNATLERCLQLAAGGCTHFVLRDALDVTVDALALLQGQNIQRLCLSGCSKVLLHDVLPRVPNARMLDVDVCGTDMHADESPEQLELMDELGRREAAGCMVDVMWCPVKGRGGHVATKEQVSACACGEVGCDECTHFICAECNGRCGCCEVCASDTGRCIKAWKPWAPEEECLNFLCDECIHKRGTKCDDCDHTMCSDCIGSQIRAGDLARLECEDSEFNMSTHTFDSWLRCHPCA